MIFVLGPIVSEDIGIGQSDFWIDNSVTDVTGNENSVTDIAGR